MVREPGSIGVPVGNAAGFAYSVVKAILLCETIEFLPSKFQLTFDYSITTCAVKCRDLASSLIVLWTLINVLWPATRRRLLQLHT